MDKSLQITERTILKKLNDKVHIKEVETAKTLYGEIRYVILYLNATKEEMLGKIITINGEPFIIRYGGYLYCIEDIKPLVFIYSKTEIDNAREIAQNYINNERSKK